VVVQLLDGTIASVSWRRSRCAAARLAIRDYTPEGSAVLIQGRLVLAGGKAVVLDARIVANARAKSQPAATRPETAPPDGLGAPQTASPGELPSDSGAAQDVPGGSA
jgi:hypothetical protein